MQVLTVAASDGTVAVPTGHGVGLVASRAGANGRGGKVLPRSYAHQRSHRDRAKPKWQPLACGRHSGLRARVFVHAVDRSVLHLRRQVPALGQQRPRSADAAQPGNSGVTLSWNRTAPCPDPLRGSCAGRCRLPTNKVERPPIWSGRPAGTAAIRQARAWPRCRPREADRGASLYKNSSGRRSTVYGGAPTTDDYAAPVARSPGTPSACAFAA